MKKIIVIFTVLFAVGTAQAQRTHTAATDTMPPCGHYVVTNNSTIAQSGIEAMILKLILSGNATITSESADPSLEPPEVDTNLVVEIVSDLTMDELSQTEMDSLLNIPERVTITPQLVTIAYSGTDSTTQYAISGIRNHKRHNNRWDIMRPDAPNVELSVDSYGIYTMKIPGEKTLRLRRQ